MSATGRNYSDRQADDFYATSYWCTRAILPKLRPNAVLDPFAGEGAILDVVKGVWGSRTFGIEIDQGRCVAANANGQHSVRFGDAFGNPWYDGLYGIQCSVVTNPPYVHAIEGIMKALSYASTVDHAKSELAFLLRINFLGSQKRAEFHKKHPSDVYVLPRRPNFIMALACKVKKKGCGWADTIPYNPDGTLCRPRPERCPLCGHELDVSSSDATEYAWFVWGEGRGGRWEILDV